MSVPSFSSPDDAGRRFAVIAESLYLANLLIAPGLAFLGLPWLWRRADVRALPLAHSCVPWVPKCSSASACPAHRYTAR